MLLPLKSMATNISVVSIASGNELININGFILPDLKCELSMILPIIGSAKELITFAINMITAQTIKSALKTLV